MSQINQQIQQIIDKRKLTRLPQIEKKIAFLKDVKAKVLNLDAVINTVSHQMETKQGSYYIMLQADPTMEARFMAVSTSEVKRLLDEQLQTLENLKKRFSRDAVQIAFIGYERQGKSCFLQSISGLNNKVIPAYSGTSCTGAVSVIHNVDKDLEVHIEFYDHEAFLKIVQEKLHTFFPNKQFALNSLNDLRYVDLSGFTCNDPQLSLEFNKFKDAFVDHIDIYESLIGHGKVVTSDEDQIIQHVSQYEEFDAIPQGENPTLFSQKEKQDNNGNKVVVWEKKYYKYIAVKSVNIYTRFVDPRIGDSKIVLVDTIGMGDASNAERIEDEMFRVLREDCDAAVDVFKPQANGDSFNKQQIEVLKKIGRRLSDCEPERWIYYVLNRVESGKGYNVEVVPAIMQQVKSSFQTMKSKPVADVIDINAINTDEVNDRLISPLLDLITNNLDDIDSNLVAEANKSNELLYQEYKLLSDAVGKVVSGSMKQGSNELKEFRKLYKTDLTYSKELKVLDTKYLADKDKPCPEVKEKIDEVINKLTKLIDRPDVIVLDVEKGEKATNDLLEKYCNIFRNRIYAAFDEVSTDVLLPLQNRLKDAIINILFENARLGRIPLQNYAVEDGSSQEWLKTFIAEKVDKEAYPHMHYMFNFVLDYQISIEGLLEYNVARCLDTLDKHSPAFKTMSPLTGIPDAQQAKKIWSEIVSRTSAIQTEMRKWRDDFSLIPSHSFYARTSMFRDLLVDDTDTHMSEELYNFYSENRMAIWRDEFAGMLQEKEAFGSWNEESAAITNLCKKNAFIFKL